ncbi:MAG: hypothetical protein ACRDRL_15485 [Sciscionella sp.]
MTARHRAESTARPPATDHLPAHRAAAHRGRTITVTAALLGVALTSAGYVVDGGGTYSYLSDQHSVEVTVSIGSAPSVHDLRHTTSKPGTQAPDAKPAPPPADPAGNSVAPIPVAPPAHTAARNRATPAPGPPHAQATSADPTPSPTPTPSVDRASTP